ncbi:Hsp20/alpha crystallin family protein [Hydrogenophaga sp.]|uniref:Hsp20/alpha crystallin family protein n=1 Tax=Hydrogenophaga sp. TaxID=1904254 RepID=UPI00262E645E|nr:Hsp20/alpha crystallin family protein [Hydrogenophaga sp.]
MPLRAELKQLGRQTDGEKVLCSECFHAAVARSFQLPQDIDEGNARAKYDNGVLRLSLPTRVAMAGQRLNID